jgi:serine/threonine protein kinase
LFIFFIPISKQPFIFLFLPFPKDKREKSLSKGGQGIVSVVTHLATGKQVAWNEIPYLDEEEEKITNELEIILQIQSEFLVPILDYFTDDKKLYIVMPYFEKGTLLTLAKQLQQSKQPLEEKVFLFFSFLFFLPSFFFFFSSATISIMILFDHSMSAK